MVGGFINWNLNRSGRNSWPRGLDRTIGLFKIL